MEAGRGKGKDARGDSDDVRRSGVCVGGVIVATKAEKKGRGWREAREEEKGRGRMQEGKER